MHATRSFPPRIALPWPLAPAVVALGFVAMAVPVLAAAAAARQGTSLGLRPVLIASEMLLAAPALLALLAFRIPLAEGLGLVPIGRRTALLALAAGASLWAASLGLLELQSVIWPPSAKFLEMFRQLHAALRPKDSLDAVLSVAAIAIAPAVCEELLFRGVVLPAFLPLMGAARAVLASALLFGVIHLDFTGDGPTFFRIPFAIVIGAGLGALRLLAGSLLAPIAAHAVLNAITFATVALTGVGEDPLETADPLLGTALFLGGSMITVIVMRAMRPSLTHPEPAPTLER